MHIPIAESDEGVWVPIGNNHFFVQRATDRMGYWEREKKWRRSTFAEFKKEFPYLAYPGSSIYHRSRTKYK